jgi:formylmethanofuran dehydrogenase subunit C
MTWRLLLRQAPSLRVDARALAPATFATLSIDAVRRLRLPSGRDGIDVGELFDVRQAGDDAPDTLVLEGDLSRFDAIGTALDGGTIEVCGPIGDCAGQEMVGGRLRVHGDARDLLGCGMRDGWLEVTGNVGDFAASARPGESDGMRGGTLWVRGRAGARLGDRMRRGTVVAELGCGDFAASRMVAGTLVLGGSCGAHAAWGMRRGTLVWIGGGPEPSPTFAPVHADVGVFWQLLSRDLARFGGRFAELQRRRVSRFVGDLAVRGMGEWLVAEP